MLKRDLNQYIEQFYASSRNALLLTGARQTGKTFAIRHFGKSYRSFIEINFIDRPEAIALFESATSAQDLLRRLTLLTDQPLIEGETLIFFDEIQRCPDILTALKFLVDDGRFRYILSGSLLGVEMKNIRSVPVGYMSIKDVFPLDFREFAENMGVKADIISYLEKCMTDVTPVDTLIHDKMMELHRLYLIVGGMPAAMNEYVVASNLGNVIRIQQDIISLYKADITQYAGIDKLKIKEIFDLIPSELDAKNKRFILKSLNEHAKYDRYADSFLWLKDVGVAIPVYNVDEPRIPLKLSETRNLFKLFSNDVGLLAAQYADGIQIKILSGDTAINFGSVFENLVAQELLCHGFTPYYYNNKRRGEVDFLVQRDGEALPIEVKSGKDYLRHSALTNLMADSPYDIPESIVLCHGNVCRDGKILYLPAYMVMFLRPAPAPSGIYRPDFSLLTR